MAHHKSAKKRIRQTIKLNAANRSARAAMRTQVKKAKTAIAEGKATPNAGDVQDAVKALANAGRKGLIHKRTAARRQSRLMRAAAKAKA